MPADVRRENDASVVVNHTDEPAHLEVTGRELVRGLDVAGELLVDAGAVAVVRES